MSGIEVGVIGAGWWAALAHIPNLLANPHVAAVSVVNPDPDALAHVVDRFRVEGFASPEAMLAERPLAGVVVSSPHVHHAEQALMCIERGLPVLVEKPMATSAADARAIEREARARGVPVMMPYGWNFRPMTDAAHRLMAEVGEVRHVAAQMASATADLFAGAGLEEARGHLLPPAASTWADPARAGGYGWGQLTHGLGVLFRLVDLDPVEVYARTGLSPAGVDWFDAAVVTLANGATVSLSGAGTTPKGRPYQVDVRVWGAEGMLLYDVERPRVEWAGHDGRGGAEALDADAGTYSTAEPVARFVDLCRGAPADNPAGATLGRRATEVLDAMHRSARSGRPEAV